jgi:uncharacterized protein (TIGR02147 family)
MMTPQYLSILAAEFRRRKASNPRYSLHALSRDSGISATRLSQILRGRQGLSVASARQIADRLKLTAKQAQGFVLSVKVHHSRSRVKRESAEKEATELRAEERGVETLSAAELESLSSWAYFAVLEAFHIRWLPKTVDGFSQFFGLDASSTARLLDLLAHQGRIIKRGTTYKLRLARLGTTQDVPSPSLRNFSKQMLERAIDSLESQRVDERDISTLTFALPKKLIPEAKKKLIAFRREFNAWAEHQITLTQNDPEQVLSLALALFRLGPQSTGTPSTGADS